MPFLPRGLVLRRSKKATPHVELLFSHSQNPFRAAMYLANHIAFSSAVFSFPYVARSCRLGRDYQLYVPPPPLSSSIFPRKYDLFFPLSVFYCTLPDLSPLLLFWFPLTQIDTHSLYSQFVLPDLPLTEFHSHFASPFFLLPVTFSPHWVSTSLRFSSFL